MKRQDRLFQKSVAGKSRHIPAGYNRRIADTLNSLPDIVPCVSEETTVHVITHKFNYKYITAVSAAVLLMITSGVCLHFGLSAGEEQNNDDPKTTVKVTSVTTLVHNGIVTEPSVTYETTSDKKTSDIQSHDVAGDPDQINKNNTSVNVTQTNSEKDKNEAAVTEEKKADKVQNTKQPAQKEPSVQGGNAAVTSAPNPVKPAVTVPVPELPDDKNDNDEKDDKKDNDEKDDKKDNDEKEDKKDKHPNRKDEYWDDIPFGKPDPAGKGPLEELPGPEHFIGGNNVQSKQADLQENAQKEAERIQREIKKAEEASEKVRENPVPCLPCIPECENEFPYPQD